jgi:hypothetical protein
MPNETEDQNQPAFSIPAKIDATTFKKATVVELGVLNAYCYGIVQGVKDYSALWYICSAAAEIEIIKQISLAN